MTTGAGQDSGPAIDSSPTNTDNLETNQSSSSFNTNRRPVPTGLPLGSAPGGPLSRYLILIALCLVRPAYTQDLFTLTFDTVGIPGLPGLHSFAAATHEGKWLLLGGRRDGLHQKFNAFGAADANQDIYVVDPTIPQVWQRSLAGLPDTLREQLQSANMAFCQFGDWLCFVGGYGQRISNGLHTTYPYFTFIDVPGLMAAVLAGDSATALAPHFQQLRDSAFAVCGGQIGVLADTFLLVGGHRFEGVYSALGGNVFQQYTDAIRRFTFSQSGGQWQLESRQETVDELHLHRRDYNLVPQVFPGGISGFVAFSGVFQPGLALLPFLNILEVTPGGHAAVDGFNQYLANYHCAKAALYNPESETMHTLFFGGMSQYQLDANDSLVRDNRIPFVRTVSRVSRLPNGTYEEVAFDVELPHYTGTSAEFIPTAGLPVVGEGVVDYSLLPDGPTLLGHIVGGIVTPDNQPNPFLTNTIAATAAANRLIQVTLVKNPPTAAPDRRPHSHFDLGMQLVPNPAVGQFEVRLQLPEAGDLYLTLQDGQGRIRRRLEAGRHEAGAANIPVPTAGLPPGTYWMTANCAGKYLQTGKLAIVR